MTVCAVTVCVDLHLPPPPPHHFVMCVFFFLRVRSQADCVCLPHRLIIANAFAVLVLFVVFFVGPPPPNRKCQSFQEKSNNTLICTLCLETRKQQRWGASVVAKPSGNGLSKMARMMLV